MRVLEISFISFDLIVLAILLATKGPWNRWGRLIALIAVALCVAHILWSEGSRWQMFPAYLVTAIVAIAATSAPFNSRKLPLLVNAIAIAFLLSSMILGFLLPIFAFPDPGGPDAIGTVTREWARKSFAEGEQLQAQSERKLTVQFWYPASRDTAGKTAPYRNSHSGTFLAQYLHLVRTHAQMNVPVASSGAAYPVVLFSPMWNSGRTQNTFEFEMLASYGFIVASIEHPEDGSQEIFNYADEESVHKDDVAVLRRANDLRFVMDELQEINERDPEQLMTGRLDMSRIGVTGHSFGGAAAADACFLDTRIKAGINMDGTLFGQVGDNGTQQPFFFMFSDGSDYPPESSLNSADPRTRYQAQIDFRDAKREEDWLHQHGGYRLKIRGGSHMNFTDKPMFTPLARFTGGGTIDPRRAMQIVNAYTLAFFEKHLKGRAEPLLEGPSSLYQEVEFEAYPPPESLPTAHASR